MNDIDRYIERQIAWSRETFGEGPRTERICRHIEKELKEVRACPKDVTEWIDVVILAIDGAWRAGHTPEEIRRALLLKLRANMQREWNVPDDPNDPVEHVRERSEGQPEVADLTKALGMMKLALASALDELGKKKVADWKLINDASCLANQLLPAAPESGS